MSVNRASTEYKQSVNNFGCCIWYKARAKLRLLYIIKVLAICIGNVVNVVVTTRRDHRQQSIKTASTERQQSVNRASTERQQSVNRASTERQQSVNRASTERQQSVNRASTEHQQSMNDFGCCILYNPRAVLRHLPIIEVLACFIGNIVCVDTATPQNEHQQGINRASTERQHSVNRASTEHQQSVNRALTERQQSVNRVSTEHQHSINTASTQHQQSVNRVLMILGVASCTIQGLCYSIYS